MAFRGLTARLARHQASLAKAAPAPEPELNLELFPVEKKALEALPPAQAVSPANPALSDPMLEQSPVISPPLAPESPGALPQELIPQESAPEETPSLEALPTSISKPTQTEDCPAPFSPPKADLLQEDFPPRPVKPVFRSGATPETAVTVSRLTSALRMLLEDRFPDLWIVGEVSNSRPAASGHYYFTLKDSGATLQAVLFRSDALRIACPLPLKDGQSVLARGRLTLYDARGQYQLQITDLRLHGSGLLQQRFLEMKQRLQVEGLFALDRKRKLPVFPVQIGIVTSLQGAVLHDLCTVLARRAPGIKILVRGVRVQGPEAAQEIAGAIREFCSDPNPAHQIDVLIIARGGGSLEDLWPFNEESVARALFAAPMPTVSAVGHETDFSISDFVADLRAPTPSAAAEMITRAWSDWRADLASLRTSLLEATRRGLNHIRRDFKQLAESAVLRLPHRALQPLSQRLDDAEAQLRRTISTRLAQQKARLPLLALRLQANHPVQALRRFRHRLELLNSRLQRHHPLLAVRAHRTRLTHLAAQLRSLGPQSTLDRGYALLLDKQGLPIRKAEAARVGKVARVLVSQGQFTVKITKAQEKTDGPF